MNTIRMTTLSLLLGLAQSAWSDAPGSTLDYPEWARQGGRCHYLMTEAECAAFQRDLAGAPAAVERERLLADNLRLLREREASCSCSHAQRTAARTALQRQAMRSDY